MTSTGFDYFGVCDVVLPSLPTAPVPPDTHIIGTYRIYREQTSVKIGRELISVYRSDEKTGHVEGHWTNVKVVFSPSGTFRNSYSNRERGLPIKLMPVGHFK
jgi:hypothetical protein